MKLITIFLILSFCATAYASCPDDFNNALSEYHFADKYFQSGVEKYNKAIDLSKVSSPDFSEICNSLVESVTGFSVATSSYGNCEASFNAAITSCTGNDSTQAEQNRDVCTANKDVAKDNHETLKELLKNTCFYISSDLQHTETIQFTQIDDKLLSL